MRKGAVDTAAVAEDTLAVAEDTLAVAAAFRAEGQPRPTVEAVAFPLHAEHLVGGIAEDMAADTVAVLDIVAVMDIAVTAVMAIGAMDTADSV
jgi:hypothetical protein